MEARRFLMKTAALCAVLVALAGCTGQSKGPDPEVARLQAENQQLQAQVKKLEWDVEYLKATQKGQPVNLINDHYPPAVAGSDGWQYVKMSEADIDGDGVEEKLYVTTSAFWTPGGWGWDDGHPWHVYVEESDGTRTYLFSNWVQLGQLRVMLSSEPGDKGPKDVLIEQVGGHGLILYRASYQGPGKHAAEHLVSLPIAGFTGYTDPRFHD